MKKILLGSLLLPVFALAACSSNGGVSSSDFKKCRYFSIDGAVLVSDDDFFTDNSFNGTVNFSANNHS